MFNYKMRSLLLTLGLCFNGFDMAQCHSNELFDSKVEAQLLSNIKQLTFPEMGFEKAGESYFSPDNQTIIFQAVPKGESQYQIYVMNIEEGIPRMVSTGRGSCTCANFRPDGLKIIFASSHEDPQLNNPNYDQSAPGYKREGGQYSWEFTPYMNIYEADPDGTHLKALTSGPAYHAECAYSSNGERIVYATNETGSMNIYTMNADGTDVQQITNTTNIYNGGPFFSPDNSKIIFRADDDQPHYLQIYSINADGTNKQKVTNNYAVNWAPYWHPNGEVIAFTTSIHGHAHYEIYLQNLTTGAECRLTHNATFDGLPVFSYDGNKVMWTSKRGKDNTCQIFLADFTMPNELK